MSEKANYFKVGLFVIGAVAIGVAAIIVLGAGALFEKTLLMETYVNESVQGLDAGSPVKYRGVQIGKVRSIGFTFDKYEQNKPLESQRKYVLIEVALSARVVKGISPTVVERESQQLIEQGLRVQLRQQGLTGTAYLELDHFPPDLYLPLPIDWEPDVYYIPSAPSTILHLTEALESIARTLKSLEGVSISQMADNLDELVLTVTKAINDVQMPKVHEEVLALIADLRQTNQSVQKIVDSPEVAAVIADVSAAAAATRRIVESPEASAIPADVSAAAASAKRVLADSEGRVAEILTDLRETSSKLKDVSQKMDTLLAGEEVQHILTNLSQSSENVRDASQGLPEAVAELKQALRGTSVLLSRQEHNIALILDNIAAASESLRDLAENAKEYPSGVLFGGPPPPAESEEE